VRFRVRSALLLALTGLVLVVLPFTSSRASAIPGAVTGVKIEQKTASHFQGVTVDITFAIPAGSRAGDTFSVTLPKSLYAQNQTFPVRSPEGNLVATGVIKAGVVTFTTTDYVENHRNVTGKAKIFGHFNQGQITPGKTNDFAFTSGGRVFHSPVAITTGTGSTHSGPSKVGFWADPEDQGSDHATDAVRWKLQSWAGPLTDLRFDDHLGAGQVNDCGSVRIVSSTTFRPDGGLKNPQPLGPRAVLTCGRTSFVVTVAHVRTGEVVQINYATTITDHALASLTNKVDVTAKGHSQALGWKVSHYGAYGEASGTVPTTTPTTTTPATTSPGTTTTGGVLPTTISRTATTTGGVLPTTISRTATTVTGGVLPTTISRTASTTAGASSTARTGASTTVRFGVLPLTLSRGSSAAPVAAAATTSSLPYTGTNAGPLSIFGGVLLLGGSGLLLLGRRRGTHAR
jgi:LPXTG-motif cell wall-anchored protein